jgi:2,4-dienoyl-CoA reductase-like NADH-dependent reductase (Old Yellow Enzyme family)
MVPWRSNEAGEVTRDVLDWYGRFADGRPGVLVVEATGIRDVPSGPLLRIGSDANIEGLRQLADVVRERSAGETRLLIQIIDFLGIRRRPAKEKFLERFLTITDAHRDGLARHTGTRPTGESATRQALAALPHEELCELLTAREREDLEYGHRERVTDTLHEHIADLPHTLPPLFAAAAARAEVAGFDGVELHYAHAYTMASFLSATNTRTDGYGGGSAPHAAAGLAGRLQLPLDVLAATRAAVDTSCFAVGCRLLADEVIEGGTHVDEAAHFATELARAGMDFLSLSKGGKFDDARRPKVGAAAYPYTGPSGHECMPTVFIEDAAGPFGRNLPLARRIRKAVRQAGLTTPVVAAGGINDFQLAESALENGACDFVAAARQSLADPDWFEKMRTGSGETIRRCKYTNYCEALDERHKEVTCQLWDRNFEAPDPGAQEIARIADGKRRKIAPPDPSGRS